MKQTNKLLCLLCLLLCFATVLISCGKKDPSPEPGSEGDSATDPNTEPATDDGLDENGYLRDTLPALDYGNETISILCWKAENPEFEASGLSGDAIENVVYSKNKLVEKRLNVALRFTEESLDTYNQTLDTFQMGGIYWDVIAAKTQSASKATIDGHFLPLNQIQNSYIDPAAPWWSQQLVEKIEINNKLFFMTGDISTNLVQMIYSVWFNQKLIDDIEGLTSPYDLIERNEWTITKMMEMCVDAYSDTENIDDKVGVSSGDQLGLVSYYYDVPALLHGCGVSIIEKNQVGKMVVSSAFKGQRSQDIIDYISTKIHQSSFVGDESKWGDTNFTGSFVGGRSLFTIAQSGAAIKMFAKATFTLGVVPCPKYDSDQTTYYGAVRQPITMYGIMNNTPENRLLMDTAVLEALASTCYRTTTPMIFETTMKAAKSTSPKMMEMLNLIRDTAYFDIGRVFGASLNGICDQPGYAMRDNTPWKVYIDKKIPAVEEKIATLFDGI